MGLGPKFDGCDMPIFPPRGNPDPLLFIVLEEFTFWSKKKQPVLVVKVNYPTCNNFEGDKVMVYIGPSTSQELLSATAGALDPHFKADTPIAPVARFMPNQAGMAMAIMFAQRLTEVVDLD